MSQAQGERMPHFSIEACKAILHNASEHVLLKTFFATLMCTYAHIWNDGKAFIPVFSLVFLDAITGVMKARHMGTFKGSRAFFRSAQKFFVYAIMLITAGILDVEFPGQYASTTMKSFLLVTEAISIMENVAVLGWPVPLKLLKYLRMHSDTIKEEDKKKN